MKALRCVLFENFRVLEKSYEIMEKYEKVTILTFLDSFEVNFKAENWCHFS